MTLFVTKTFILEIDSLRDRNEIIEASPPHVN